MMPPDGATSRRRLIVNADDFGQSSGITEGVLDAHRHGIVTSASLMVRFPGAAEAAARGVAAGLDLGLHADLGEFVFDGRGWVAIYEVVGTDDEPAVRAELERQLETFLDLVCRPPTHLDSHQHAHRSDPVRGVMLEMAARLDVPLRGEGPVRYEGGFYGQDARGSSYPELIDPSALLRLIEQLPAGVTELGCHPGRRDDELASPYRSERSDELSALCDRRVREALDRQGVLLTTFAAEAVRGQRDTEGRGSQR
ncbi:MAG: ChbG/HpnK family deacetylase [Actinobacteria bacterium]|nr:ChbG/HpnK family deacetylase [Actinomycetota bacterium]